MGIALPQDFPHLGFGVDPDHQLGNQAVKAGVRPVGQGAQVVPDQPLTRDDSGKVLEQFEIAPFRRRPGRIAWGDHGWVRTGWAAGSARTAGLDQGRQLTGQQVADPIEAEVGGRVLGQDFGVQGIVSLPGKDGGDPASPHFLGGGQDTQLVVHQQVVVRRIAPFHVLQLQLLVHVDQNVVIGGFQQPGLLHLARLEHHIAVGEDRHRAPLLESLHHLQRVGVETIGEGIIEDKRGNRHQARLVRESVAIALQGSQVVGVSQLVPQFLENGPIAPLSLVAHRLLDVAHEIRQDPVVVQQGVVGIEKERDGLFHGVWVPPWS